MYCTVKYTGTVLEVGGQTVIRRAFGRRLFRRVPGNTSGKRSFIHYSMITYVNTVLYLLQSSARDA